MTQLTEAFIDALHRLEDSGNVDVIASLFSDDAELSNPLVKHDASEADGPRRFWKSYIEAFQDIESEFVNVLENEDVAALEWRSEGVIDGAAVRYGGVSVIESADGKITAFRAYFDPRKLVARGNGEQVSGD
ncbi:nuclear transport factor 2 family protein [Pararhizobium gei]|uniref:nuclear transport factor 2 family protein n=1 Tax=Pararhizobium gei TaxID=1395951 RepID=UPI0023DAD8BA|nr:nuclear transport factor 2 family protein [Rhizobium gei]